MNVGLVSLQLQQRQSLFGWRNNKLCDWFVPVGCIDGQWFTRPGPARPWRDASGSPNTDRSLGFVKRKPNKALEPNKSAVMPNATSKQKNGGPAAVEKTSGRSEASTDKKRKWDGCKLFSFRFIVDGELIKIKYSLWPPETKRSTTLSGATMHRCAKTKRATATRTPPRPS